MALDRSWLAVLEVMLVGFRGFHFVYVCIYIYIYVYVCIYIYVYVYIYISIFLKTYIFRFRVAHLCGKIATWI